MYKLYNYGKKNTLLNLVLFKWINTLHNILPFGSYLILVGISNNEEQYLWMKGVFIKIENKNVTRLHTAITRKYVYVYNTLVYYGTFQFIHTNMKTFIYEHLFHINI